MTSLIKRALASLESIDVKVETSSSNPVKEASTPSTSPVTTVVTTSTSNTPPQANNTEGKTIAIDGPLSTIYFKALNIAYAKVDPVTGVPAIESQQQDYYYAAVTKKKLEAENVVPLAEDAININPSGTMLKASMSEEVIPVFKEIADTGAPIDFSIVYDTMTPTTQSPVGVGDNIKVVINEAVQPIALEDILGFTITMKLKKK